MEHKCSVLKVSCLWEERLCCHWVVTSCTTLVCKTIQELLSSQQWPLLERIRALHGG